MPTQIERPSVIADQYTALTQTVCDISEAYYELGRLADALRLLEAGAQLVDAREVRPRDYARLLLQHGKLLTTQMFLANGDFDATMAVLARARQISADEHDQQLLGRALNLIGQATYFNTLNTGGSDWDAPLAYFEQAVEQHEVAGDTCGLSDSLFHIGLMHERKTQHDQAIEYYERALDLTARHGYKRERSYATRHLAGIYQQRGDLEQALSYFKESLALREEIGLKLYLPFAHISVGDVLYDQGDVAGALAQYQQAYALSEEMDLKAGLISASLSLGYAHKEQQAAQQALDHFERTLALAKAIDFKRGIAIAEAEIDDILSHRNAEGANDDANH